VVGYVRYRVPAADRVVVLWVRSYYAVDMWQGRPLGSRSLHLQSARGIALAFLLDSSNRKSGFGSLTYQQLKETFNTEDSSRPMFGGVVSGGVGLTRYRNPGGVSIPYLILDPVSEPS
jgi:hypothetical protein